MLVQGNAWAYPPSSILFVPGAVPRSMRNVPSHFRGPRKLALMARTSYPVQRCPYPRRDAAALGACHHRRL